MKLKRDLVGTGQVFHFTLVQLLKSKSGIISLVFLFLLSLFYVPLITLSSGGTLSGSNSPSGVTVTQNICFENNTPLKIELDPEILSQYGIKQEQIIDNADLICKIGYSDSKGYTVTVSGNNSSDEARAVTDAFSALVDKAKSSALSDKSGMSSDEIDYTTGTLSDYTGGKEEPSKEPGTNFVLQYIYSIVIMMLCILTTSYIIRSVIEEKSSKLVELLMVSVQPLALLLGKILAQMLYVMMMLSSMILGFVISCVATAAIGGTESFDLLATFNFSAEATGNVFTVSDIIITAIVMIVSIILGYLTFSIIAGILGTACSSIEETGSAVGATTLIVLGAYIISIFAGFTNGGVSSAILSIFPVISVFCAPIQFAVGNIGFGVLLVSWIIQAAIIVLLAIFCAKIYSELLLHRGNRIKLSGLIVIFKNSKGGEELK